MQDTPVVKAKTETPTLKPASTAAPKRNEVREFSGHSFFEPASRRNPVELNPTAFARPAEEKPKTTREQAAELHKQIEKRVQKPPAGWTPTEASQYTDALAQQVEANKDNPELVRSLMTLSGPQLRRSAQLIGQATETNDFNGDDVEKLTGNLSRIGNVAPEDAAARLAYGVAEAIPEDSEQNKVDDGFGHFIDKGGGSRFRDMVAGALQVQEKGDAAEELVGKGGGSSITDRLGDVGEFFAGFAEGASGAADDAFNFGGDVAGAVVDSGARIIGTAGDFAVDTAKGTIDFAGDVASLTQEEVEEGVKFAVEKGLQPAGLLLEKARGLIRDAVLGRLNIEEKVHRLRPGDSLSIGGSGDVTVAGGIGVEADLQVKANEDGSYTVSGAVEADLGLKLLAGASLGAGGKVEFTFPNQEEALKATESLVLAGSPLLAPSGGDLERLANHVSAVELSSKAAASLDDALKLGDTSPFSADVESGITYRLEIEDGKPVALSREQHLTGNVSADLASVAFKNVDATAMLNFAEARATANVSVSTRLRLPDDIGSLSDVLQTGVFIADPTGGLSNLLPNAQTSIKGSLDVSAGGSPRVGAEATFEVPDVELTDGLSIANNLAQGRLAEALQGLPEVKLFGNTYKETGFLVDGGMKIAGQGIELNLNNAIKDVQTKFEVTV